MNLNFIPNNVNVIVSDELPASVHGCIAEVRKGKYVILLNANDSEARRQQALEHELWHYYNKDFEADVTVNEIEKAAHRYN